jgi:hypothetical protein
VGEDSARKGLLFLKKKKQCRVQSRIREYRALARESRGWSAFADHDAECMRVLRTVMTRHRTSDESFLVLFFKKEQFLP